MDEDKNGSTDVSEKRKIEDDTVNPKPNPKRIKLVRPVFKPVVKPTISTTTEPNKPDVLSEETAKSNNLIDKISSVVDVSLSPEKPTDAIETTIKSFDVIETTKTSMDVIETTKKHTDMIETTKTPTDMIETTKKPTSMILVSEEQLDNSSDVLDISNIFSEETKKELEHLKKNIFKIDDDGSSSENDSQPKRPRLKRPTFITSSVESKDSKSQDKTNESPKLDTIKSVCEDTINKIDKIMGKQLIQEEEILTTVEKSIVESTEMHDVEYKTIVTENSKKCEEKSLISRGDELVKEKIDETKNDDKFIADEVIKENINSTIGKIIVKNIDTEIEQNVIKNNNIVEELKEEMSFDKKNINEKVEKHNIQKVNENVVINDKFICEDEAIERKHISEDDIIEDKQISEDEAIEEKHVSEDDKIEVQQVSEDEAIEENHASEDYIIGDKQVSEDEAIEGKHVIENEMVEEKYLNEETSEDKIIKEKHVITDGIIEDQIIKENNGMQNTKLTLNVKQTDGNKDCKIKVELCDENDEYIKIESDIDSTYIDKIKFNEVSTSVITIKNEEDNLVGYEEQDVEQVENDMPSIILPSAISKKKQNEKQGTQIFKSDILKAALMSKKSPEILVNSTEVHDQLDENICPTSLETNTLEILPKIGQAAIINKIEAEIKLSSNVQSSSSQKAQSMVCTHSSEINISEEPSSSTCLDENVSAIKHNEPPKWGSAKMNEVEKFLNDSNVTITPICKPQETPKLGKITLKLPKVGNPEIKTEITVRPDVKSELIKKITNKQIAMGESPLKNALSQPSKSFSDYATIRPAPKPSAEQIALLEQQILNTPKKRGRPSKALALQKQLLLQYQQQQQQKVPEGGSTEDEAVFHVPLFDMEDMSGVAGMFDSFDTSTPKRGKSIRGKGSRGRRGRGGRGRGGHDGSDSDTTSNSRRIDDEGGDTTYQEEMNQEEETKQVAMMEAERLRKEEERERKIEERKKKLKERNDILKEKKLKKKQKAEERRLQWHEKKRLMQEEKARAAEMKKSLPPPQNFDDETRMSADCNNSRSQTPARNFMMVDDDLSISGTTNDSMRLKKGRMEVIDLESNKTLTVDQIAEYQWPLEGGELYMIQEQISNFLGVKSFKRKYPGLKRRNVEAEERTFLCDSGLVAESLCDLGLTVLFSSEVLDVMYTDFPEKYEELREYMRLKHAKELSNRQRALMTISSNTDGSKLDLRDRAMEAVANWNANLNKSRLESRKCSMDMQTFIVHYPKNKCKKMTVPKPKMGSYPLALLPGQFCDYYATYSSEDLRYLPMNTVMYGPLKSVDKDFPVSLSSQSESEDSSSDDSSESDDSMEVDNKLGKNGLEYGPSDKKGAECKLCLGNAEKNKLGSVEPLIHCSKCLTIYHPTCLDMTLEMIPYIKRYNWQCNECKSCAQCKEVADEDKMLFCDLCDRGYHIYCVGLRRVPEGRWHCQECAMCSSCSVTDPGPGDSKWFYEFKKVEKTGAKVYSRTLCAPCSRLWKKGHYCPNCMRCYPIKNIESMTQCNSCDRYLHSECINESNSSNRQVVACAVCEEKAVSRLLTTVPRSLIKV